MSFEKEKNDIIFWARLLSQKGFASARSGNVSFKIGEGRILMTGHDSYLGCLEQEDIVLADGDGNVLEGSSELSSERGVHFAVYKKFKDVKTVLHTHSPYTTAFFSYFNSLDVYSFEEKFYLGKIEVIAQDTPTVTDIDKVIAALENNNIVVLKNHGVLSVGRSFKESFALIELLEQQAKINFFIKSAALSGKEASAKAQGHEGMIDDGNKYKVLSDEHVLRLVELVNNDDEVQGLGRKYDLTCTLAVKNQDSGKAACFYYQKGKIIKFDGNDNADFVITGKEDILRKVFNRQIDPFVASTQGKVKTKGDFAKMSKWYPVLVKTFELWENAPVE